ncbi:branched-chain amino acid ABC transporter permease [Arhodomonas sp. SL1]|uniref:branched-chain amino acid ABC transporter permease n=1 Tax=Arhodomonas sp. SL1 TaxID=3425691 RepID=UPI003F884E21
MSANDVFLQLVTGLQMGAIYALIALGLTLIFGTLGVVNFAHGALYVIAIYAAVTIGAHLGFWAAVVLVPALLFVVGIALERGIIQRFYDRPHTDQILVTFGIALVVEEGAKAIFGANNIPYPVPDWGQGQMMFYGTGATIPDVPRFQEMISVWMPFIDGMLFYPTWRIILVLVALLAIAALFSLLQFTRFGLVVRSGMRDAEMLRFLGINITARFAIVFGLGALIAGIAGVFGGPVTQVTPEVGMHLLVPSFLVVVIGGMGSLPGALIAAVLLGMALSFSAEYSAIQQIVIYLVAVVVLLVRPRGLLGKKGVLE